MAFAHQNPGPAKDAVPRDFKRCGMCTKRGLYVQVVIVGMRQVAYERCRYCRRADRILWEKPLTGGVVK